MIKNLAIGGVVGLLFMSGSFFAGLRFVHVPVPKKAVAATAKATANPAVSRDAIGVEALRKTTEGMMDVTQALQAREQAVAAREKKARERDDELNAESAALDRSHAKFHELYGQFQQRLQLVTANEADQLQRQMAIYTTMDPVQAADLLRSLDDGTIVRLFSIMETKPLAKLVAAWKTKYPGDSTRVLTALTQMGTVMPQDKIALSDSGSANGNDSATPAASTPDSNSGTPSEATATPADASSGDVGATTSPNADPSSSPADTTSAPSVSNQTLGAAPTPDSTLTTPTPETTPAAPAQTSYSTPNVSGTDASASSPAAPTPASETAPPAPATPPTPASPSLAPPPDASTGSGGTSTSSSTVAPVPSSLLGVPGETGAAAAALAQRRSGRLSADISTDRAY